MSTSSGSKLKVTKIISPMSIRSGKGGFGPAINCENT